MNGKKNHLSTNDVILKTHKDEQPSQKITAGYTKLSDLYYKYIEYNPELEKILKYYKIEKKQYLKFLISFLDRANAREN